MQLIYSPQHNAVVWRGPLAHRVVGLVPGARALGTEAAIAPLTIEGQVLAAKAGLPTTSPILYEYDWPRSLAIKAPFQHQKEMAAFLTLHHRCHNHAEIGTGKTLGALWAADYLMRKGLVRKVLIISPLSTLEAVWRNHIGEHFAGIRSAAVLHGSKRARIEAAQEDVDFYIINNEGMTLEYTVNALHPDIDLVIVDEAHRYRNRTTERYKALKQYLGTKALWLCTGTPTPNEPTDAYAQQALIEKPGVSYRAFQMLTMQQLNMHKWVPRRGAEEVVAQFFTPVIRFRRDECIDIPETQVIPYECPLTPTQATMAKKLRDALLVHFNGKEISAVHEGVLRQKVLQVLAGAVYDDSKQAHTVEATHRLDALRGIIEGSMRKLLIFTPWKHTTRLVAAKLRADGYSVAEVTGDTPTEERNKAFAAFQQQPEPRIIVAHPATMAHGLTLTEADTVVWYAPVDSGDVYVQACGRVTRPGQKHKTLIYQLYSDKMEKEIYKRLESKEKLQNLVMAWLQE